MILDLCGGEASECVVAGAVPQTGKTVAFDPAYTTKLSGIEIPAEKQVSILETLGFTVSGGSVTAPSWRGDIEGKADLVEEIIRIYGLDNLTPVSMKRLTAVTQPAESFLMFRKRRARLALSGRGMQESITWSFMSSSLASLFGANDNQSAAGLRLLNPISSELDQMRPSILPNLLQAAGQNRDKGFPDNALFEVGPCFHSSKPTGQTVVACGVRGGANGPRHWSDARSHRAVDVFDAKADAFAVLEACGLPADSLQITTDAPSWYHPGRSGVLRLGANVIACFGEIHPATIETLGIKGNYAGFEVFIERIPETRKKAGTAKKLRELNPLQPVFRDFAFTVDTSVQAADLVRAAKAADKALVTQVEIFDVYTGDKMEPGKKSVAISVTLQPKEQTLTDKDLETVSEKIITGITSKTGGALRQ
jgi:phenylalanyl-tRNA synthetase beta chain